MAHPYAPPALCPELTQPSFCNALSTGPALFISEYELTEGKDFFLRAPASSTVLGSQQVL